MRKIVKTKFVHFCTNLHWRVVAISLHRRGLSYGRRRTIQVGVILHLISYIGLTFSDNLISYGVLMTLCDGVSTFLLAVFSSYGVEVVGPSGRKYFGSLVGVAYALGFVLISVLAMYFPDRQMLTAVISGIW